MNRLVLTLLLMQGYALAQPSEYMPIPNDATWLYECRTWVQDNGPNGGFEIIDQYLFQMGEDTVINDTAYVLFNEQKIGDTQVYTNCALRQDMAEKKVFARPLESGQEYLLYDFDLEIGDTLACPEPNGSGFELWPGAETNNGHFSSLHDSETTSLESLSTYVGSVPNPGESVTNIYNFSEFSWGRPAIWAEGIGSLMFFSWPCSFDSEFTSCNLIGFCAGDSVWAPWENACSLSLDIDSKDWSIQNELNTYWDGQSIVIRLDVTSAINLIRMFDLSGKLIFEKNVRLTTQKAVITGIPESVNGLYILQAQVETLSLSQLINIHR